MTDAIRMCDVTRYYDGQRGVQQFDLCVNQGSVFGLLGENGSGKTTALKLAVGALLPDCGRIQTLGVDPAEMPPPVRARIGWLSDRLAVPDRMNLEEAMELQRSYFPTWNQRLALDLMAEFGLTNRSVFGSLSLGQKKRFMLTLVLAQMPELLVLDEPAGGLDPAVRRQLIEILMRQAAERQMTVVLSSHILSDVERLVDTVAFVKQGRVLVQDELENLRGQVKRICFLDPEVEGQLRQRFRVREVERIADVWRAIVEDYSPERLNGLPCELEHLNLEELFLLYNGSAGSAEA